MTQHQVPQGIYGLVCIKHFLHLRDQKEVDNLSTVVLFDIANPNLPSKRLCILSAVNIKAGLD